jgi:hypothetical protein
MQCQACPPRPAAVTSGDTCGCGTTDTQVVSRVEKRGMHAAAGPAAVGTFVLVLS